MVLEVTCVMIGLGFKENHGRVAMLSLYVDDIIVKGDDENEQYLLGLGQHQANEFEIKTLGKLKYFLEVRN